MLIFFNLIGGNDDVGNSKGNNENETICKKDTKNEMKFVLEIRHLVTAREVYLYTYRGLANTTIYILRCAGFSNDSKTQTKVRSCNVSGLSVHIFEEVSNMRDLVLYPCETFRK